MQPSDGRSGSSGALCAYCNKAFLPGQRVLWKVKVNTEEEFGWTATHLLCPRTVGLLLVLMVLAWLLAVVGSVLVFVTS